jgi:hypothetical protein
MLVHGRRRQTQVDALGHMIRRMVGNDEDRRAGITENLEC